MIHKNFQKFLTGIGLYVVEKLLKCQITVILGKIKGEKLKIFITYFILGVRNPDLARRSIEKSIDKNLIENGKIYYEKCDTGDMKSVNEFAEKVKLITPSIHILINNGNAINI